MEDFRAVISASIVAMVPADKQADFDPFLKFQSFWSMLHGLVSINMLGNPAHEEGLAEKVLEDVLCSFIRGMQGQF